MSNPLAEANLRAMFAVIDANGSGYIEAADFEHFADQVCATLALDPDTPAHAKLRAAYRAWWEQIRRADTDEDGRVSCEEYVALVQTGVAEDPHYYDNGLRPVIDAVFDAADADGSGAISRPEFARLYEAVGESAETANGFFDRIDTDSDGSISREEYAAALQGIYAPGSADDASAWVLGGHNR
ncbi:EF-hand domain-containing protein [Nonomuraea sp. NPDC049158]|uniref:EF-hand domain-containing protein n=1 Tax=Nonomuraea sp. NPDC049158 TaxID=3155649 RepID=UPI0033C4C48D